MNWHWKLAPEAKVEAIKKYNSYRAIAAFYGERAAARSQVPLINHIHEGLLIMARAGAKRDHMEAYCLYPLFQNDAELSTVGLELWNNYRNHSWLTGQIMALVMEYRNQANAWLSDKVVVLETRTDEGDLVETGDINVVGKPTPGPMPGVRMMLIADKVQNRKDFLRHHVTTHARRVELRVYFAMWMAALGIDEDEYARLSEGL